MESARSYKASNVTEEDYWAQIQTSDFIVDGVDDASLTFNNTISRATTEPTLANYAPASYTQYFFYEMNEDVVQASIEQIIMSN